MNNLFLALIFAIIGIILIEFHNRTPVLYFLICATVGLCIFCFLFGIFCTFADVALPTRIETIVAQRNAIDLADTDSIAAFNRKVNAARAPWCLRYLFYDPAYRGIQPLPIPEPDFWEAPMLTINSKDVAAAEPTAAALAEEFQELTYLELRQNYGYEIHKVATLTVEDDRLLVAINSSLAISLSMSAYNKCWRLWHNFPSLEERRGRYWR